VDRRAIWVGIGEMTRTGDTARVVVYRGQHLGGSGFPTFWLERTAHVFEHGSTGWRFIRRESPIHADGGEVRGG
jgi:hypothetical protein